MGTLGENSGRQRRGSLSQKMQQGKKRAQTKPHIHPDKERRYKAGVKKNNSANCMQNMKLVVSGYMRQWLYFANEEIQETKVFFKVAIHSLLIYVLKSCQWSITSVWLNTTFDILSHSLAGSSSSSSRDHHCGLTKFVFLNTLRKPQRKHIFAY